MSALLALAVTIWACTPLSQTHLNPFPCLILPLFCRHTHILATLPASSLSAWPLVGCWIQVSGEPANESAPCTQPCIWRLHGTTCMCVHLSCCSCANQIIPGVRLIDAFCPPFHSYPGKCWYDMVYCRVLLCMHEREKVNLISVLASPCDNNNVSVLTLSLISFKQYYNIHKSIYIIMFHNYCKWGANTLYFTFRRLFYPKWLQKFAVRANNKCTRSLNNGRCDPVC